VPNRKRFSIAYRLVSDPGASGDVVLYTVEPAATFKTESVYVSFPAGTYSELEVSIYRGIMQIAPSKGAYVGDNQVIEDEFVEDVSSGERVILHYKNNNTTQTRECFVIVRGYIER
jgi:hypothetical protein